MTPAGFPHSDISGSTPACDSPELFAANHVLHRLLTPRHSPCALSSLVTNLEKSVSASLLSLSRYAVYKVEYVSTFRDPLVNPLTLDCFVRSCISNDVLKTRFRVVVSYSDFRDRLPRSCRLATKGGKSIWLPTLRQESLAGGA